MAFFTPKRRERATVFGLALGRALRSRGKFVHGLRTVTDERLLQEGTPEQVAWHNLVRRQHEREQYAKGAAKMVMEKLQLKLYKATLKDVLSLVEDRKWVEQVMAAYQVHHTCIEFAADLVQLCFHKRFEVTGKGH